MKCPLFGGEENTISSLQGKKLIIKKPSQRRFNTLILMSSEEQEVITV